MVNFNVNSASEPVYNGVERPAAPWPDDGWSPGALVAAVLVTSICSDDEGRTQSESGPPSASIMDIPGDSKHWHHSDEGAKRSPQGASLSGHKYSPQGASLSGHKYTAQGASLSGHKYSREGLEVSDAPHLFSRPLHSSSPASYSVKESPRLFPESDVTHHPRYEEVKSSETSPGSRTKRPGYPRQSPNHQNSFLDDNSGDNCQTSQVSLSLLILSFKSKVLFNIRFLRIFICQKT